LKDRTRVRSHLGELSSFLRKRRREEKENTSWQYLSEEQKGKIGGRGWGEEGGEKKVSTY